MKQLVLIPIFFLAVQALAQDIVQGVIKNGDGVPLTGATVSVKSTAISSVADGNGAFRIAAPQTLPFTLLINFVSYKLQEIEVYELTDEVLEITLVEDGLLDEVIVTSRRRQETAQQVPIPISVVSGSVIEQSGAFNVNRVKEIVPSVQLYTSNPRNTGINIRGIGSPFGLTNDGLDPGVGFYVDGVYYARPAAATLDFIDVEQIEVLRGPQGTLFGKNTTAGAFNITTRKPTFTPEYNVEVSYGNYGYLQAKSSINAPFGKKIAGRFSFSGTQRDGTIENVSTGKNTNDINNLGLRGQLLYEPSEKTSIRLSGDNSRQRPDGYAQVVAGVAPTERATYRQFTAIIADLNYALPSENAFDRKIDHDTPWNSGNDLGGVSLTVDQEIGPGTLTSTTAWRYWNWDPSNDRDFTGLQALAKSQNPAEHKNWSQEIRYAGSFSSRLGGVIGLFYIDQDLKIHGTEESGSAQWRFSQSSLSPLWQTPGLFEGYGIKTESSIQSKSASVFANVDWEITKGLHFQPGVRYNYDEKNVIYDRQTYGGLDTATYNGSKAEKIALQNLKSGVYSSQYYVADADEKNVTYLATLSYQLNRNYNAYVTYSTGFKPVGVNVAGIPTINGQPATDLAVIEPEDVRHFEAGVKSSPLKNFTLNATIFNTDIENYQTNVQSPELGVNRGYIANAEKVNVFGAEVDGNIRFNQNFSLYTSIAYTDGKYVTFINAPLPLEETGHVNSDGQQEAFKDISGERLPGVSKWAGSLGGEVLSNALEFLGQESNVFFGFDGYYRSEFSSSPSPSKYLNIDGYALFNARAGFRSLKGVSLFVWGRNLFDQNYYEQLLPAGGNAGHYAGVLGDPRTYGVTIRYTH
jgi:iron complex outermembrane receptor protein